MVNFKYIVFKYIVIVITSFILTYFILSACNAQNPIIKPIWLKPKEYPYKSQLKLKEELTSLINKQEINSQSEIVKYINDYSAERSALKLCK